MINNRHQGHFALPSCVLLNTENLVLTAFVLLLHHRIAVWLVEINGFCGTPDSLRLTLAVTDSFYLLRLLLCHTKGNKHKSSIRNSMLDKFQTHLRFLSSLFFRGFLVRFLFLLLLLGFFGPYGMKHCPHTFLFVLQNMTACVMVSVS